MNPRINYTLVGAFVLLLLAAGLMFISWMTQDSRNSNRLPYVTYFYDSVSGLNERAPVKYRGVPVGYVERISLVTEPEERVRLDLRLDADTPVRTDTYATLQYQGITGLLFVELQSLGNSGARLLSTESEPVIIPSQTSRLVELTENLDQAILEFNQLAQSVNQLSRQLNNLVDDDMKHQLINTLSAIEQLSNTAERRLQGIDPDYYRQLAGRFPEILERAETSLSRQLELLGEQLNSLSDDTRSSARQLTPLMRQTEQLLEQLRLESNSWLRGNRSQPPGPGE
ncbi:MlaD family protein [Marinospirillum alkaliphilum]|uniref:Phospholipid/cholesterol/gamma-HCH transport system substrate-binding protein n=1 Tax=Marinospirillum alkaliphilum DSM 21637 TaxID=1122209 RepID=A0A1K1WY96_9GAMM|nr:MlaD family protein [Marinospirillum alkaliphilum]SFX42231.1 phospholipid/cholesterol/gamma-HCH transport system substrate-binding protein [Marinospirillum alkaliphilum DSM 21637]